jgi:polyisoprenyl-teichoic acid--peptidoglycan teichoic acid transferase
MLDDSGRPRRARHSRSASTKRSAPRDISRLAPSAASDPVVRQTDKLRARPTKDVSPAARDRRRKRLRITIASVVGVLVLAGAVGAYAYMRVITNKINGVFNSDPALQQALAGAQATAPGDPFYMVLMGSDTRKGEAQARSDTLILARIDPQKKKIALISIPRDSKVAIPGEWTTKINAAAVYGGPALVIKTLKELTGLPITHFVNLNFNGFRDVVDAIGGVWIDVPFDIYDTKASYYGAKYATVKKGYQKLDGRHALTFVRTRHTMADSDYGRMRNQQAFIKALGQQALSLSNVFNASSIINAIASNLDTDMTPAQLADLVLQFKGMGKDGIDTATAPSAPKYVGGISYVIIDETKFHEMIDRMKKGLALEPKATGTASTTPTETVKPADVKLTIRNGAGVSGLGKQCTDFFTGKGFAVAETGNMAKYVYGRTLVVYQKGSEAKANFVRETLGFGDVLPSAGMYTFTTPVMVVIGKDWKNPVTGSVKP